MPQFTIIKNIEELKNETIKGVRLQDFKLEELRDLSETFDPLTTQRSKRVEGGLNIPEGLENKLTMSYETMAPFLIKAIQEQIEELKKNNQ